MRKRSSFLHTSRATFLDEYQLLSKRSIMDLSFKR
jgi:hypothetical protein